jgi:DNA replication protein DnaC
MEHAKWTPSFSRAWVAFNAPAENLALVGGTGASKTHPAKALGIETDTRHGKGVFFYSGVELVNTLQ